MKNVLFLGLIYDKTRESHYLKRSNIGLQNAINNFQWNLIDGFVENNYCLQIVSVLPVGIFPKQYKELFISNDSWKYCGIQCYQCGDINLHFVKQIGRTIQIYKQIEQWIEKSKNNRQIIYYSLYIPFQNALRLIKRKYPDVRLMSIVADLPSIYGLLPSNPIKKQMAIFYGNQMISNTKYCDSFVLLTEQMKQPLKVGRRPYVVIEGVCSSKIYEPKMVSNDKKVIFYSGTLHYQYGIKTLLDAFALIKMPNVELWICGSGDAEEEIKIRAINNDRISFFGFCSSDKVTELRSQATVLVNPRRNEGEYTKYSFPSKTIEYMLSGIPVVMYKLDGIPEEYNPYLHYVDGTGVSSLKDSIVRVLEQSDEERRDFGKNARDFILNKKNSTEQIKKLRFIIR